MQELSLNKRKKEIIKGLMKDISSTNNNEEKLKLYQSILKIGNTEKRNITEIFVISKTNQRSKRSESKSGN